MVVRRISRGVVSAVQAKAAIEKMIVSSFTPGHCFGCSAEGHVKIKGIARLALRRLLRSRGRLGMKRLLR